MAEEASKMAFFGWEVQNKIHNSTDSFWGEVDTTHAFCEPHYAQSRYFAEFFNSISSLVYCLVAFYLLNKFPNDRMIQAANLWLGVLGLGSALFHGTMKYSMQLMDEGPMVGWMTTLILAQLSCGRPWLNGKVGILQTIVVCAALGLFTVYAITDEYEIFVHGFSMLSLFSVFLGMLIVPGKDSKVAKLQRRAMIVCVVAILIGKLCWELENRMCDKYPAIWPLHPVWHFLSCLSVYAAMINGYLCRMDENAIMPKWIGFRQEKVKTV